MPIPTMWPVDAPVTQKYGQNPAAHQPDGHTGIDFGCAVGTKCKAVADGTVVYADWSQGLGWPNPYFIAIDFTGPADGDQSAGIVVLIDHGPFLSIYAHLNQTGLNPGDKVKLGEVIGQTGNTGFSTGPHLHYEILPDRWDVHAIRFGRVDPALYIGRPVTLAPNQRLVGPLGTNGRSKPRVEPNNIVRVVAGGTTEVMDGWINGQVVSGIGVWFHDRDDIWYWSGGFESQSTAGLKNMNPAPAPAAAPALQPKQRITGPDGARRRSAPDKNSQLLEEFGPGKILTFKGFVKGTDPFGDGNSTWFVGAFGEPTYFWSGAFLDKGTHDLPNLTAPPQGTPTAVPIVGVPYDFAQDFLIVNGITVEKAAAHLGNVDTGNFPQNPSHAVLHWWDAPAKQPTLSGVLAEFTKKDTFKSSHWVVDADRVVQVVALKDRAFHSGPGGNDWVGIEINPLALERTPGGAYTPRAQKIQANVRSLLTQLRARKGYKLQTILHKQVPGAATDCSDLELADFEIEPPVVIARGAVRI